MRKFGIDLQRSESGACPDSVDRYGDDDEIFFPAAEDQGSVNSSTLGTNTSRAVEGWHSMVRDYFFIRSPETFAPTASVTVARFFARIHARLLELFDRFGAPSEALWPYDPAAVNVEPPAFVYQAATPAPDFYYFRLADVNSARRTVAWKLICSFLAAGFPIAFGFSVPTSISRAADIQIRPPYDSYSGGMAAVAVGYDFHRFGRNQGGFLIRTSWGTEWGADGYGWLPIRCVTGKRLATAGQSECNMVTDITHPDLIDDQTTPSTIFLRSERTHTREPVCYRVFAIGCEARLHVQ